MDEHSTTPAGTTATHAVLPKPEKVNCPNFDLDESSEKWECFKTRWNIYKTITGLFGNNVQIQLMETCGEKLRFAMFQYDTKVDQKSETDILAAMKRLSVEEDNVMVTRVNLHTIRQDSDEPIKNFSARLRGQAELCKFDTDVMFCDLLIRGLDDRDIRCEIGAALQDSHESNATHSDTPE